MRCLGKDLPPTNPSEALQSDHSAGQGVQAARKKPRDLRRKGDPGPEVPRALTNAVS